METKSKKRERLFLLAVSIILITALSFVFFNMRKNYLYTNRDRLVILAYQTNISGSDGEEWAKRLKEAFPQIPDFEVSVYETRAVGNDSITVTSENGWGQVVVRLGSGHGDILFVNNEVFYSVLMKNGYLLPLAGDYARPLTDENGTVYGVDITGTTPAGLLNHGTSKYVGPGQPLPVRSIDESDYKFNGYTHNPRVIAVIYRGTKRPDDSLKVFNGLFEEAEHVAKA